MSSIHGTDGLAVFVDMVFRILDKMAAGEYVSVTVQILYESSNWRKTGPGIESDYNVLGPWKEIWLKIL